jgi:hypothetical protein
VAGEGGRRCSWDQASRLALKREIQEHCGPKWKVRQGQLSVGLTAGRWKRGPQRFIVGEPVQGSLTDAELQRLRNIQHLYLKNVICPRKRSHRETPVKVKRALDIVMGVEADEEEAGADEDDEDSASEEDDDFLDVEDEEQQLVVRAAAREKQRPNKPDGRKSPAKRARAPPAKKQAGHPKK